MNIYPLTKSAFLFAIAWLTLASQARAVCQDTCLTNFNTAQGIDALISLTTGANNTAIGFLALHDNTTGFNNTANGFEALLANTTGNSNTANGVRTLHSNTTGTFNTANGLAALQNNTTGTFNTANGEAALLFNTTGNKNTANDVQALFSNATGSNNTANGFQALFSNTTGVNNMANGSLALLANTTGFFNMANGSNAMVHNTTGNYNVAEGLNALRLNTTGSSNTAVGLSALLNNTAGGANIALGGSAGSALTTGSNNIDIGNVGVAAEANTIRIGTVQTATYIVGISGKTATVGAAVFVASNGKLGTVTSSRRFKKDIADMDAASEALLALRPVTFRYKPELDKAGIPQFGLVAEEVAEVNPDLVVRDEKGEIYTVRYEAVNAMLLNEFLKEHRKVEKLESIITKLTARLDEQDSKIQKVSAQLAAASPSYGGLETTNPAPRVVANKP